MKRLVIVLAGILSANASLRAASDSSEFIFNDRIVNDYRITFYQSQWDTLLRFNKDNDEVYMPARFTWYGPGGDSIVLDSVGVRYKGNSSYVFAGTSQKKPFKVSFNKYRKSQLFFRLEKLNFNNGVQDPSCMREKIAYDVLRSYMPAPRAVFATLTVEDSLIRALYTQVEQVDEQFLDRHFGNHKYNLYKAADQGATLAYKGVNQSSYESDYELKTNETENDWSGLIDLVDYLNSTPDADFVAVVGKLLDIDNCIRYLAFNMVNANFDSYTGSSRNYYLYDNRKVNTFKLIPWDLNLSFGVYQYSWSNVVTVDAFAPTNLDQRPLAKRVLSNDSLKRVYANYMRSLCAGPLSADSVRALAYRLKPVIDSSVRGDMKKFYTYEQFCNNIDTEVVIQEGINRTILPGLVSFTTRRNTYIQAQIEKFLPAGGPPARRIFGDGTMLQCRYHGASGRLFLRCSVPGGVGPVRVGVYNARGALLRSICEQPENRGICTMQLDMRPYPPGYYAIRVVRGKTVLSRGALLMN
ncbi:MAG: CotH kinase family protein [Chitinispirillaceae bacterium]|nr:CotH kinase family protein [Chitinispirillaceae bacterium]